MWINRRWRERSGPWLATGLGMFLSASTVVSADERSLPAEVERLLSESQGPETIEELLALGTDAAPILLEQIYVQPDPRQALSALARLGRPESLYPLLDYLIWVRKNRPAETSAVTHALGLLGDPRAAEPMEALLNDPGIETGLRLQMASSLVLLAEEPEASRARRFILGVYAATIDFFDDQDVGERPYVTLHMGGAGELIDILAALRSEPGWRCLRDWLEHQPLNLYEGTAIVEHLRSTADIADDRAAHGKAILTWVERLSGDEYDEDGLAMTVLVQLLDADLVADPERFTALVTRLFQRSLAPFDEYGDEVERLTRAVEEFRGRSIETNG